MADHAGLLYSLALPLVCYVYIAYYGRKGHVAVADAVQVQSRA
jgi:fucose permease